MAKAKTMFFCSDCGGSSAKWFGRCPHCGAWNTAVEEVAPDSGGGKPGQVQMAAVKPQPLNKLAVDKCPRYTLGMAELDNVLGGGLHAEGSLLLGGEPGIGKSTLLLQAAQAAAKYGQVLYISGEESAQQIAERALRLNVMCDNVYLLAQTDITAALQQAAELTPALIIIDSVQAAYVPELDSAAGSVPQVRAVAAAAIAFARLKRCALMLIGHVTKEGQLAGPRILEHMVDTVLYFEGERYNSLRLLRAIKNRFGSTNEIGVFEMGEMGLQPLSSPSAYFLQQRQSRISGSAVACVMQGSRPLLVEAQALVAPSSFANPRRQALGFDYSRLLMIIAVLERKLGLPLGNRDVYLNIAGGLRVDDPAADLAAAAAIVSSFKDQALEDNILLLGEIGLLGELRSIGQEEKRLKEAAAFGFKAAVVPPGKRAPSTRAAALKRLETADLAQALRVLSLSG
ncbi:MAG: DNA repair protein RadA [Bacillota bacterium]|nr:DNA repair protein RadA [Bacillota bacterium]